MSRGVGTGGGREGAEGASYNPPVNIRADGARPSPGASSTSSPASPSSIADVAVVGGGIVGAAAALAAAHGGLSTVWVTGPARPASETRALDGDAVDWDLRVYAINPATRAFLDRLRVWSQLDATRMAPVRDMRVFGDHEGRASLHFGAYAAGIESLATIVEHRALARGLETAAGYFPGIERIEGSASDLRIDTHAATLATPRGPRRARLVIAADGAASPTREALGLASTAKPYAQRAVVGHFATERPHAGAAHQWFTDEGVVALLPLPDIAGRPAVSLVWSAPDVFAGTLMAGGPADVAARLGVLAQSTLGRLDPLTGLAAIPLAMQYAPRLVAARGALVGDAAHVVHPLAGQGLNLGLEDVAVLVDRLVARETFRDCGDIRLLRRYERARAEPVFAMRQVIDGLVRMHADIDPTAALVRRIGMQLVDRAPPLKRLLVRRASGSA